jgi:hypothetical protein
VYSAEERACIDRFAARFEPEWTLGRTDSVLEAARRRLVG